MSVIVADLETDAIHDPCVIHMVGILDFYTDEYTSYHGDDVVEGLLRIAEADLVIGHHFRGYDAKHITRLTDGLIAIDPVKIIDTLDLSRALVPEMPDHKLSSWGLLFDFPKLDHLDFARYTPEMDIYCERDVRLTKMVFEFMLENFPDQVIRLLEGKK